MEPEEDENAEARRVFNLDPAGVRELEVYLENMAERLMEEADDTEVELNADDPDWDEDMGDEWDEEDEAAFHQEMDEIFNDGDEEEALISAAVGQHQHDQAIKRHFKDQNHYIPSKTARKRRGGDIPKIKPVVSVATVSPTKNEKIELLKKGQTVTTKVSIGPNDVEMKLALLSVLTTTHQSREYMRRQLVRGILEGHEVVIEGPCKLAKNER